MSGLHQRWRCDDDETFKWQEVDLYGAIRTSMSQTLLTSIKDVFFCAEIEHISLLAR